MEIDHPYISVSAQPNRGPSFEWHGSFWGRTRVTRSYLGKIGPASRNSFDFRFLQIKPLGHSLNDYAVVMRRDNPLAYPIFLWHRILRPLYGECVWRGMWGLRKRGLAWWPEQSRLGHWWMLLGRKPQTLRDWAFEMAYIRRNVNAPIRKYAEAWVLATEDMSSIEQAITEDGRFLDGVLTVCWASAQKTAAR